MRQFAHANPTSVLASAEARNLQHEQLSAARLMYPWLEPRTVFDAAIATTPEEAATTAIGAMGYGTGPSHSGDPADAVANSHWRLAMASSIERVAAATQASQHAAMPTPSFQELSLTAHNGSSAADAGTTKDADAPTTVICQLPHTADHIDNASQTGQAPDKDFAVTALSVANTSSSMPSSTPGFTDDQGAVQHVAPGTGSVQISVETSGWSQTAAHVMDHSNAARSQALSLGAAEAFGNNQLSVNIASTPLPNSIAIGHALNASGDVVATGHGGAASLNPADPTAVGDNWSLQSTRGGSDTQTILASNWAAGGTGTDALTWKAGHDGADANTDFKMAPGMHDHDLSALLPTFDPQKADINAAFELFVGVKPADTHVIQGNASGMGAHIADAMYVSSALGAAVDFPAVVKNANLIV